MVGEQLASEATFTEQVEKLNPSATCDMLLKSPPSVFPINKCKFQELRGSSARHQCQMDLITDLCEFLNTLNLRFCLIESIESFQCVGGNLLFAASHPIRWSKIIQPI